MKDWALVSKALRQEATPFSIVVFIGLCFGSVGGFILFVDEGYKDIGQLLFGGLFGVIGVASIIAAFVMSGSSAAYYYDQALLKKYGVDTNAVLIRKQAQCHFHQQFDYRGRPLGEGVYCCELLLEFDYEFRDAVYRGSAYIGNAEVFDKVRVGDTIPLRVLSLDPLVKKVRERKLSNSLKNREPEPQSQIPIGAEISQPTSK